ncbi:MAG: outer membrane protein transport protein [Gammaproteobacteria bacterium]|nr:outer membrane protein transport protein [Gammaproteobacteria bacterium]MBU1775342.1 outer membrane protein transport protein [Gammaproteobacteria bacterium]MBU1969300.1 outer membrane protein transport protein [Gammaproteobacteria bacterium]
MFFRKSMIGCSVACALQLMSGNASASAFALIEQSSGLGNSFAGGAAAAEDATTIFFNPAGMTKLKGDQVTVAASFIDFSAKFSDTGSTGAALQTAGGNGGDAGALAVVPNTYIVAEIEPVLRFGLGINAPFGLMTEYDPDWIGRFQAIDSKIQTININPSLSYEMNDIVSLGIGLNYQHITGELTSAVNYSAAAYDAGGAGLLTAIGGPGVEGVSTIKGSDSAWGYNLGVLFQVAPETRWGLSYRSKIKYTLNGTITFADVPAALTASPLLANGDVTLPITMPDSLSISVFHQMGNGWDIMADATRTGWSVLQEMKIDRSNGSNVLTVQEKWKDTWRVAAGASYHYNEQWLARMGVAYDQTPVPDAYRTARIPDNDRTWISVGGQYKVSQAGTLDFGYAHLFVKDASIADMQAAAGKGDLVGTYKGSVNIVSVQYAHSF